MNENETAGRRDQSERIQSLNGKNIQMYNRASDKVLYTGFSWHSGGTL
jgi:hypothetical protein